MMGIEHGWSLMDLVMTNRGQRGDFDMLGVLESTRPVVEESQLARINQDGLAVVADKLRAFKQQEASRRAGQTRRRR